MKIAVIALSKVPSTTANSIQVMKICQAYTQMGLDVALFVPGKIKVPWEEIAAHYGLHQKFNIYWINSKKLFRHFDFLMKAINASKRWKADVFHTWIPQISMFLKLIKKPILMELHELPTGRFGPFYYRRLFLTKNRIRFLPITRVLWLKFAKLYQFLPDAINHEISPDGVDIERYEDLPSPEDARNVLNLPNAWSAVYTGHLYTGRGMTLLTELARQLPQVQFIWVGGNQAEVEEWQAVISDRQIKNVILTGFVKNELIPQYQAAGDVLLMPYEETVTGSSGGNTVDICSPMKMFEYMATGRIIISSDLPVLHEVLNESNAIFCNSNSISEWSAAVLKVLADPEQFQQMGRQARMDVKPYSWIMRSKKSLQGLDRE